MIAGLLQSQGGRRELQIPVATSLATEIPKHSWVVLRQEACRLGETSVKRGTLRPLQLWGELPISTEKSRHSWLTWKPLSLLIDLEELTQWFRQLKPKMTHFSHPPTCFPWVSCRPGRSGHCFHVLLFIVQMHRRARANCQGLTGVTVACAVSLPQGPLWIQPLEVASESSAKAEYDSLVFRKNGPHGREYILYAPGILRITPTQKSLRTERNTFYLSAR